MSNILTTSRIDLVNKLVCGDGLLLFLVLSLMGREARVMKWKSFGGSGDKGP